MKRRILLFSALAGLVCISVAVLYAQQKGGQQAKSDRVDLETETLVGKRLEKTEDGPNGEKIHHYLYRVEARQTAKGLPRYIVDYRYNITYETKGFKSGDTITLLSANEETETDSPIWLYTVSYVGSGVRKVTFNTSGSVMAPMFATANSETGDECPLCYCDLTNCSGHGWCSGCNPACSENGCPASCPGSPCPCSCHPQLCGAYPGCYCTGTQNCFACTCHFVIPPPTPPVGPPPPSTCPL